MVKEQSRAEQSRQAKIAEMQAELDLLRPAARQYTTSIRRVANHLHVAQCTRGVTAVMEDMQRIDTRALI